MLDRRLIPSLSALTVFEAATRTGSFARAADECSLTHGAVSRQMRNLEEVLGAKLFVKQGRNVRMTDVARAYQTDVRLALEQIATATRRASTRDGGNAVQLGILPTFSSQWLIPRMGSFMEEHPGTTVNMKIKPHPFDFRSESLDAAIHVGLADWPDADCDLLFAEQAAVVAAPALTARYPIGSPADLIDKPLLSGGSNRAEWPHMFGWSQFFSTHRLENAGYRSLELATYASIAKAAVDGQGFAIIPLAFIESELRSGQLVIAHGEPFMTGRAYYLVFPHDRLEHTPLRRFRNWILKQAGRG